MGNTDEPPVVNVDPKDWFKKPERPPTPDLEWNKGRSAENKSTQKWLNWNNPEGDRYPFDLSKPLPLVMSGNHQIIPVDYFFNNDLAFLQGGSTDITYTTSLTKTKAAKYDLPRIEDMHYVCSKDVSRSRRVEDLQLGGESYQKKLNISRPMMHKAGIIDLKPYSVYSNP
ncbi:hypothetical protein Tco_0662976 [Tanacetum coccineum]